MCYSMRLLPMVYTKYRIIAGHFPASISHFQNYTKALLLFFRTTMKPLLLSPKKEPNIHKTTKELSNEELVSRLKRAINGWWPVHWKPLWNVCQHNKLTVDSNNVCKEKLYFTEIPSFLKDGIFLMTLYQNCEIFRVEINQICRDNHSI